MPSRRTLLLLFSSSPALVIVTNRLIFVLVFVNVSRQLIRFDQLSLSMSWEGQLHWKLNFVILSLPRLPSIDSA